MSKFHIIHDGDVIIVFIATSFLLYIISELSLFAMEWGVCGPPHKGGPAPPQPSICKYKYWDETRWVVVIIASVMISAAYYKISRKRNPQYYDPYPL